MLGRALPRAPGSISTGSASTAIGVLGRALPPGSISTGAGSTAIAVPLREQRRVSGSSSMGAATIKFEDRVLGGPVTFIAGMIAAWFLVLVTVAGRLIGSLGGGTSTRDNFFLFF